LLSKILFLPPISQKVACILTGTRFSVLHLSSSAASEGECSEVAGSLVQVAALLAQYSVCVCVVRRCGVLLFWAQCPLVWPLQAEHARGVSML
jgi:hypothetical protein